MRFSWLLARRRTGVDRRRPAAASDACVALAELADRLATGPAGRDGRTFLRALAHEGAGVRTGWRAVYDLAAAGRNALPGRGFRPEYDDGTGGQVRHFVGTARAVDLFGRRTTQWVQVHVRRDSPDSADGRLGDAAVDFAGALIDGTLQPQESAAWIHTRLCDG